MVIGAGALVSLGILARISGSGCLPGCMVGINTVSAGECQSFVQLYHISETVLS